MPSYPPKHNIAENVQLGAESASAFIENAIEIHDRRRGISPPRNQNQLDLSYRNTFERLTASKPFLETGSGQSPHKNQHQQSSFGGNLEKSIPLAPVSMNRFVGGSLNFKDIKSLDGPRSMRSLSGKKQHLETKQHQDLHNPDA